MRARFIILLAVIATAIPAVAIAQSNAEQRARIDNELRAREAQQNLQSFEAQQRSADVGRRVDDLDIRLRTQQNLQTAAAPGTTYYPTNLQPMLVPPTSIDLRAQAAMQSKELDAQNERLRQLDKGGK